MKNRILGERAEERLRKLEEDTRNGRPPRHHTISSAFDRRILQGHPDAVLAFVNNIKTWYDDFVLPTVAGSQN